jgi:hypothetical protein
MTGQEALTLVDTLLHSAEPRQGLNDVQSVVLLETWTGSSYREIAKQSGYEYDYIKQVGSQLWRSLSQTLGEPVSKRNLQAVLRRYQQSQQGANALPVIQGTQDWGEAIDVSLFYGRQVELQTLETWILSDSPSGDRFANLREGLRPTRSRLIGIFGLGVAQFTASSAIRGHPQRDFAHFNWLRGNSRQFN